MQTELLKTQTELKNNALKQLQKEREIMQERLTTAIAAKEEEWRKICEQQVAEARKEERALAEAAAEQQARS
jgi:hypothetical protein